MAFILREHSHNEASNCEPSLHHRPSVCSTGLGDPRVRKLKTKRSPSVVCLLHCEALELIRDVRLSKEQKTLPWGLYSASEEQRSIR